MTQQQEQDAYTMIGWFLVCAAATYFLGLAGFCVVAVAFFLIHSVFSR